MSDKMEELYQERLARYTTAMRNQMPDRVPIRPFVAEFTAHYAGFTCQEVTHDFLKAFEAARKCAADFDWDAVVSNMVYVWTGLTEAAGIQYYGAPGIDIPAQTGFQYHEPSEEQAFMKSDEYDALIDDPTGFLYDVWLPRVTRTVQPPGSPNTRENNLSLVRGAMAMMHYFNAFGEQNERLRTESGTVSAIAGILKAPFDIMADKLRGYLGLTMDMYTQPKKVLAACEALAPHILQVAMTSADSEGIVPIGFWMHRGCVPFVSPPQFESHYWPTLRPIIEELWASGRQTLFYAEGDWGYHLDSFAQLPDRSIVYHVDRGDIFETHRKLGDHFCLSGGIPNILLSYGTKEELLAHCRHVWKDVGKHTGYIADAGAIMQNDTSTENLHIMTDFFRENAVYSQGHSQFTPPGKNNYVLPEGAGLASLPEGKTRAGVCTPYEVQASHRHPVQGDEELVKNVWEMTDGFANMYIWQLLLSF
jgi:hypothetical protein